MGTFRPGRPTTCHVSADQDRSESGRGGKLGRVNRYRALAVLAGLIFGLLAVGVAPAGPASAHAGLVQSEPQSGAVLASSPRQVVLTFTEPVRIVPGKIRIIGPDGRNAGDGAPAVQGSKLRIPMKETTERGSYLISFRVISADSHPISGAIPFSIGAPSANAPTETTSGTSTDPLVTTLLGGSRYVGYAGLALVTGPALFLSLLWPRRLSRRGPLRLVKVGVGLVVLSSLAEQYLQAPYHAGTGLFGASAADLREVFNSQYGAAHLVRIGVIAALAVLLPVFVNRPSDTDGRVGWTDRALVAILAVVGAATWPVSGHPAATSVPVVTTIADVAHLGAMAVWIGGLVTLFAFVLRRANARELSAILPVWSRWATIAVGVLVVAGTIQALVSLGSVRGLYDTTYGRLLLTKIAITVGVLAVAWYSRRLTLGALRGAAAAGAAGGSAGAVHPGPAGVRLVGSAGDAMAADEASATGRRAAIRIVPPLPGDAGDPGREPGDAGDPGREPGDVDAAEPEAGGSGGGDGVDPARRRLRRSVLLEVLGTVAVLAFTSALVQTTPAKATLDQADRRENTTYNATLTTKLYSVQVQLEPKSTGPNTIHLYAFTPQGAPIAIKEWKVTAALPAQGIEPVDVPTLPVSENHAVAQAQLSAPGTWQLRFTLRTSDIDAATAVAEVPIA
jgi:putative copper export protein/methionine-rich copper-binding protein CopC